MLDTLVRRAFWRSTGKLLRGRMCKMTRSGLRLNVECRCTKEPLSLFKVSAIVNTRIIHIYLLPLFFYWCKVVLLKGRAWFPQGLPRTCYCRDRVSSCNIYAVQQDTLSFFLMIFYSSHMLARNVSDLTGPFLGAFYKLCVQIWYVVIRVLLDMSSCYEVTTGHFE